MPIEERSRASYVRGPVRRALLAAVLGSILPALAGCGEPSVREYENRRELEALLTAVSLKNAKELEKDAGRIEARHASGALSDAPYKELREIIEKANRPAVEGFRDSVQQAGASTS